MVNWRIPLSFFTTIIASTAIGNSCLYQLRSLFLMALSLPICGGLYFYCMIIDGTVALPRYNYCQELPENNRKTNPLCLTNLYTTVVLMDFALVWILIYTGLVTWYHRKSLMHKPLTSNTTGGGKNNNNGTPTTEEINFNNNPGGEDNSVPDVNVFRQ